MTPDAPRPDEADVELWPRAMRTAVASGRDVILPVAAARVPLAEYDRRGAALADAQAEVARLTREVAVLRATGRVLREVLREAALTEGEWDCIHGRIGEQVMRALAASPAPCEESATQRADVSHNLPITDTAAPAPAEDGDR